MDEPTEDDLSKEFNELNEKREELNAAFVQQKNIFDSLLAAGFTETQALKIVTNILLGNP